MTKITQQDPQTVKISKHISLLSGFAFKSKKFNENGKGMPLIRIRDLQNSRIKTYYEGEFDKKYVIKQEDILVGMDGEFYVIKWSNKDALLNQRVCKISNSNKFINTDFLFYSLQPAIKKIHENTPATTVKHLSTKQINDIEILLPSLPEQTRIAAILSKIDSEIEKVERIIEQIEKLKKGLMQKLLTKGIGHTKFKQTELGEIPEEWEIREFIDFATLQRGFDLPKQSRTEGVFPLVSSNGITDNLSEFRVKAPGVVTGRSGTIGNVFYIEKDFWPLNTTLYIKDFHENNEKFVYYAILQFDLSIYLTGTGVPTLNRNVVHKRKIAIPPMHEQKKIVIILEAIDEKLATHKRNKSYLLKLKKGLMNDLLSGKVRVNH